jgi:BirA family transcriptional regulator, biotin operon repressor / biotin---[acetyl-CoA-carboxylase] ligase
VSLGSPRVHHRAIESTNALARQLAERGAPHGALVTASEQTAGRGRQGRSWTAVPGRALLCSLVFRKPPRLLPLAAGVAVVEEVGEGALLKWPNDVLLEGRKVAGILVEGRPQEQWAVLGIGLNVAMKDSDFSEELRERAAGLGRAETDIEPTLARLLDRLEGWINAPPERVLAALREHDALLGNHVRWHGGEGRAAGIDDEGRLLVAVDGGEVALESGEVHLV